MERIRRDGLVYYQFRNLNSLYEGPRHAIFTRRGGSSPPPFDSLNVGSTVGDAPENVRTNHERLAQALQFDMTQARTVWQVHGADVLMVGPETPTGPEPPRADAMVTNVPGVPLVMRYADCVPLVFFDPRNRVIGLAHAGWRGTVAGVGSATVRAMVEGYGSRPQDIMAGIGPSIGPCCYEVGPEVLAQVVESFNGRSPEMIRPTQAEHGAYFDLWTANRIALEREGLQQIEVSNLCTSCHSHEFFSHRAEAGRTGRFAAAVMLPRQGTQ